MRKCELWTARPRQARPTRPRPDQPTPRPLPNASGRGANECGFGDSANARYRAEAYPPIAMGDRGSRPWTARPRQARPTPPPAPPQSFREGSKAFSLRLAQFAAKAKARRLEAGLAAAGIVAVVILDALRRQIAAAAAIGCIQHDAVFVERYAIAAGAPRPRSGRAHCWAGCCWSANPDRACHTHCRSPRYRRSCRRRRYGRWAQLATLGE